MSYEETERKKLTDCRIYNKCHLRVSRDVTVIELLERNMDPVYIKIKSGTSVHLVDPQIIFCQTTNGGGSGPLVRLEITKDEKGEVINSKENLIVIPADCLELHPNVL